ncbi:MAG TPA: TraR/DksA C4-type zinc finger protein [Acidimicrobiales bacterium]|nr:TraR/DksA C4-type zinc finger protein [Acidimicrobiales bacterium]
MPVKMTKSPGKTTADKAASPRRSSEARPTRTVAKSRKVSGKVAGRPERKAGAKLLASRLKTAVRGARSATRATTARPTAKPSRGATKVTTRRSPAAPRVPGKVAAARPGGRAKSAGKVTAPKKVVAAKKVATTKRTFAAGRLGAAPRITAGEKTIPTRVRRQSPGAKRSAKAPARAAVRSSRAGAKVSGKRATSRAGTTRPPSARPAPDRARRQGYTEERFLSHQRNVLERERATYIEQANSLQAEAEALVAEMEPGDIQFDEESGEGGTVAVDRERDLTISAQALEAVAEIDAALAKIKSGRYGVCEGCGELIPKLRLEALPYARLCIACKSGGLSRR